MFVVERLQQQDLSAAKEIHAVQMAAYAQESELIGAKHFPPLNTTLDDILRSNEHFFGITDEGELRAVISLYEMNICSLVVAPNHQRKGLATCLLKFAIEQGHELTVMTSVKNTPALALYAAYGFTEYQRCFKGTGALELVFLRRGSATR
ncbi:GNAT family N-acetyltransferase [Iodobacter fluviatilis]|uniref:Acetyltransferase (GNAT) family protein n=1 Tax=Iodobacter fluviatilis TaxID=537 RepID=A0A377Q1I7_9NEIS|nr:GNAT family N-acetyltransferase [Iodobacter fluviatilis]TCU90109.1 acetyltransferase (GNAT) family protein [Iodobacter fluviatilis]STQ89136.1 putative acyltransferase [Iodobacter fluviatilis]